MILPKRVQTSDELANRTQDATAEAFRRLQAETPILNFNIVTATVGTSATEIQHGLARAPLGYIVVDRDTNSNVWTDATVSSLPDRTIRLIASASVRAKILFF